MDVLLREGSGPGMPGPYGVAVQQALHFRKRARRPVGRPPYVWSVNFCSAGVGVAPERSGQIPSPGNLPAFQAFRVPGPFSP